LVLPAAAGATTLVGPTNIEATGAAQSCDPSCTLANVALPDTVGLARSPVTGTISRWRANIFDGNGPIRLQVLKRTHNEAGTSNDEFMALRQSGKKTVTTTGKQSFTANRLPIRRGQFIGVVLEGGFGTHIGVGNLTGGDFIDFEPPLAPGDAARNDSGVFPGLANQYLLLNATVRP